MLESTSAARMLLVTGANGFVGHAVCEFLQERNLPYRGAVRSNPTGAQVAVGDLDSDTDWSAALVGCKALIHLAARVHVMDETAADPLGAFRIVNVDATLNLARQAIDAGVSRFVYVSSIKVNGEATQPGRPYRAQDAPAPSDAYGISKMEAEHALLALAQETGLEVVIVRPPLVYGPQVKANFARLIALADKSIPLPLGAVRARRSMVSLDNLVDLLMVCVTHPDAPGEVFLVSDGVDLTIGELITSIRSALGRKAMLLPFPRSLLMAAATVTGKRAVAARLLDSLQVDISHTQAALKWRPAVTPQQAIHKTVAAWLDTRK